MNEILKMWELRGHPFSPRADEHGQPYQDGYGAAAKREFWLKALDPRLDVRFVDFYFDFYDWQYGNLVQKISTQAAFEQFPSDAELNEPKSLMILMKGSEGTGVKSLRNLLLHKIRVESNNLDPVVVSMRLDNNKHDANLLAIARYFRDACEDAGIAKPTREELKQIYEEEEKYPNPGAETFYADLFKRTNTRLRKHANNPTVLLLSGQPDSPGDTHDAWRVMYNSTSALFRYIIVTTTNDRNALDCNTIFRRDKLNVSLIVSRELGRQTAEEYLRARLGRERTAPPQAGRELTPFTQGALEQLFVLTEAGKSEKPGPKPKTYNIAQINKTFLCALDYRLHGLQQAGAAAPKLEETLIGPDVIMAVRELINQGKKCPVPDNV